MKKKQSSNLNVDTSSGISSKRVEGNNYDTRKQVLQYDDVMREQREIIYAERHDVITRP